MLMKNRMNIQMNEAHSKLSMFAIQILHLYSEHTRTDTQTHSISIIFGPNLRGQTILKMVARF